MCVEIAQSLSGKCTLPSALLIILLNRLACVFPVTMLNVKCSLLCCLLAVLLSLCFMTLNKLCARPHNMPPPLYAQLQPVHALRLRRPARLAYSSCGGHEYSWCTWQTTKQTSSDRQKSDTHHFIVPPGRGHNNSVQSHNHD